MAIGPRLSLKQSQSLVMTPQLQQAIKLLALSNLELESFIADAIEANPLLEAADNAPLAGEVPDFVDDMGADAAPFSDEIGAEFGAELGRGEAALDIDHSALDIDRDTGDGAQIAGAASSDGGQDWGSASGAGLGVDGDEYPSLENHGNMGASLAEHLLGQIGAATSDPRLDIIARHIIALLDDAGYLQEGMREIASDLGVSMAEAEAALALVQTLDPTGVGARSLGECLALQAKEADRYDPYMERLLENLDLVGRGEFARLKRICGCDDEDLASMLSELREYDPKPGLIFSSSDGGAITPDILLTSAKDGSWNIAINEASLPRLIINREYVTNVKSVSQNKDDRAWLNDRLADANWLIKALDQRQKTILKTAAEIVKRQDGFFRRGVSELRPLTLREVAEAIDMHESTISRVTSNKYLACERGTFELKFFFTSGVGSKDGEGASSETVKARIRALTDAESAKDILSDDKLVELLNKEGFDLARRTVAKYREAMGIGSSVERRRAKKIANI